MLIWYCANCGAPAQDKKKPCDCATNVGMRDGPNGSREQTWWDDPPDKLDRAMAALKKCRDAYKTGDEDDCVVACIEASNEFEALTKRQTEMSFKR